MNVRSRRVWLLITIIVAASFAVRVAAWAYWQTGAIESEGAEYSRIAENLRNGVGYVGLVTPGAQLNFNPLFPLLIAGTSALTHDYELAGRLVALFMGALLPLPVFGVASRLFSRRVGFIAAVLAVLHPLLVHLSFTVFSEGPYITLLLSAVYLVVRALDSPSINLWLLVGGAFGLSYLVRAEGAAGFVIAVLFALTATQGDLTIRCKRVAAAVLVFGALALPEVIFIYRATGKVKIEGKSAIFSYDAKRILAAERNPGREYVSPGGYREVPSAEPNVESGQRWEEKWAFFGIDSNLKGMGFPMRPHVELVRETQITLKDLLTIAVTGTRQNARLLLRQLSSDWFGAPLLPALALLGAVRRPWRGKQGLGRLFVWSVAVAPVAATFVALRTEQRYYFVLIPLLSIFAANGLVEVGLWMRASSAAAGWRMVGRPMVSQYIVPGLIGLAMVISPIPGLNRVYIFAESAPATRVDKEVGWWIGRQQDRPVKIMDLSIPLAFHAGSQFTYFPYCSGDQALQYLDAAKVDYVVLRRGEKFTQYYEEWLAHGVPDHRAELVQLPSGAAADKFVIYRWHGNGVGEGARRAPMQTQKVVSTGL